MTTGRVAAIGAALAVAVASIGAGPGPARAAATSVLSAQPAPVVSIGGAGVATYPAFDPGVRRYAVTTTQETGGTLTVTTTGTDPDAVVSIDGVADPDGTATVTGLSEGDEVSVWIDDASGRAAYDFVYLPAGFPTLTASTAPDADLAPGLVMLGLSNSWLEADPSYVEVAVDRNGVPAHVESFPHLPRSLDLKRQPNGHYSVARTTTTPGRTGEAIVELDARFHEVDRHETVGLTDTDGHDAILEPDGTAWLMAYENDADGRIDSIIQRIEPDAQTVTFQWSSAAFRDETVIAPSDGDPLPRDYAHINSFEVMSDGDLLVSFRNLDAVYKIATSDHDGFTAGEVVWKLGGRDSSFAFADGEGGPCGQHSAHELPNGDILIFDNGSGDLTGALCLPPGDPEGAPVQRLNARAVVFSLDEDAGTATVVRSHEEVYSWFAGSTQPLPDDHVLVGWASANLFTTVDIATELDADDDVVWSLRDPNPVDQARYFSYRAHLADVPDATPPTVSLDLPATVVQDEVVPVAWTCADRGGSGLGACDGSVDQGAALDTATPGRHTVTVTATDEAGNDTTVERAYDVRASYRPDAWVRTRGGAAWKGDDRYGSAGQRAGTSLRRPSGRAVVLVRLQNDGARPDRIRYDVRGGSRRFQVSPRPLTGHLSPLLQPGESWTLRVQVTRLTAARPGDVVMVRVPVRSTSDASLTDEVSARVTARR